LTADASPRELLRATAALDGKSTLDDGDAAGVALAEKPKRTEDTGRPCTDDEHVSM